MLQQRQFLSTAASRLGVTDLSCYSEKTSPEWGNCGDADKGYDLWSLGRNQKDEKCLISNCPGRYSCSRCQTEAARLHALLSYRKFVGLQNVSPISHGKLIEDTEGVQKSWANMERNMSSSRSSHLKRPH